MKFIILFIVTMLTLFANFDKIDVNQVNKLFNNEQSGFSSDELFGVNYDCKFLNNNWYCISENKKLILIKNGYKDDSGKYLLRIFDYKSGKILMEGNRVIKDRYVLTGRWKIYDYKHRKIKYINFNKKARINKQRVANWAKKQDSKLFTGVDSAIYKNQKSWQVNFLSMKVFINAINGKFLGFKLNDSYHYSRQKAIRQKYECVKREFKKATKICDISRKCKLLVNGEAK